MDLPRRAHGVRPRGRTTRSPAPAQRTPDLDGPSAVLPTRAPPPRGLLVRRRRHARPAHHARPARPPHTARALVAGCGPAGWDPSTPGRAVPLPERPRDAPGLTGCVGPDRRRPLGRAPADGTDRTTLTGAAPEGRGLPGGPSTLVRRATGSSLRRRHHARPRGQTTLWVDGTGTCSRARGNRGASADASAPPDACRPAHEPSRGASVPRCVAVSLSAWVGWVEGSRQQSTVVDSDHSSRPRRGLGQRSVRASGTRW